MLSVAYARQMPANGGQIDGLKASQRQMQGCADLDVLSVRLVATVRAAVIEIESDPDFGAE